MVKYLPSKLLQQKTSKLLYWNSSRCLISGILFPVLLAFSPVGCSPPPTQVLHTIDGDTVTLANGHEVRYIGIDAPEKGELYYQESWQANAELVEGEVVRLEQDVSDKDRYGRLLRYVYVNGVFVNAELVKSGWARAKAYPPDTKYQDYLEEMERQAREAKLGMWLEH